MKTISIIFIVILLISCQNETISKWTETIKAEINKYEVKSKIDKDDYEKIVEKNSFVDVGLKIAESRKPASDEDAKYVRKIETILDKCSEFTDNRLNQYLKKIKNIKLSRFVGYRNNNYDK